MKLKNFRDYIEKRLDPKEIAELEQQARIEREALRILQDEVSCAIANYMSEKKIGFNELVRRSGISPSQLIKIQKGEANLTLATLAHIAGLLKMHPHITFAKKKRAA